MVDDADDDDDIEAHQRVKTWSITFRAMSMMLVDNKIVIEKMGFQHHQNL